MIEGNQYIQTVEVYFNFPITEFGLNIYKEKVKGNAFYDVQYKGETHIVSISYENMENYLLVIIFLLENGELPDYDDKTRTLHLKQLNEKVLSKVDKRDINLNNEYFFKFQATGELERKLLKSAKELRLCLKHFLIKTKNKGLWKVE